MAPIRQVRRADTTTRKAPIVEPWRSRVASGLGSGFVIEGNRIMTNAYVVSWSKQLIVHRYQDPKPYRASRVHWPRSTCYSKGRGRG